MELFRLVFSVIFGFFSEGFSSFFEPVMLVILFCWVFYWTVRLSFMRR